MTTIPTTILTENAEVDPFTDEDYIKGLRDLRDNGGPDGKRLTNRQVQELLGSTRSHTWWGLRLSGERTTLDQEAKNELRPHLDELPPLPEPVNTVIERTVDPNARVVQVGTPEDGEKTGLVLLVNTNGKSTTIKVNGKEVSAGTGVPKMERNVPKRHRLTTSTDEYRWMKENGYSSVTDLIEKIKSLQNL
ncbi:hypothetical protein Rctr71_041 [Virus Rctr71]|nr:hypothetical protein Rctr71_041 [Virus Rctr71]